MNPPQRGQLAELTTVLEHKDAEINGLRRRIEELRLQAVTAEDSATQNGVYRRISSQCEIWF
jgi:hypothetical protein